MHLQNQLTSFLLVFKLFVTLIALNLIVSLSLFTNLVNSFALHNPSLISPENWMQKDYQNSEVSSSPGYFKAAEYLKKSINESADPCEDFFAYACGRWITDHPIPNDLGTYGVFASIREKVAQDMKALYETKESSGSTAIDAVKSIFQACMDTQTMDNLKGREIVEAIEKLGSWPIIVGSKWSEKSFDLTDLMIKIAQSRSVDVLIDVYVSPDQRNNTRRLIHIDQGSLGLGSGSRQYYTNVTEYAPHLEAYENYITSKVLLVAHDAGIALKESEIENDVKEIIKFEKKIAKILVPEEDRRNWTILYNLCRMSNLKDFMSEIDWDRYFSSLIPSELKWYLDENPTVNINEVEFLKKLNALLKVAPKRVIANYVIWRYTSAWSFQLDSRYDDIQQEFLRVIIGKQTKSPRWKDCSQAAVGRMSYASGALYVRSHFKKSDKNAALQMVDELRKAFKSMISESDWMEDAARQIALKKTDTMISLIGYPEFIENNTELDDYYKHLHITANDTYATTVEKTTLWLLEDSFRKLAKPFDRTEFGASASTVNAYYSSLKNAIVFPAAILQIPLFDRSFPKAMNFGGIGSIIGHEMTHGFDDQGSQFDESGNLREWWDERTANNFNDRKKCFIKTYGDSVVPGTSVHINGILTQGENIADNGGMKEAFRAYQNYVAKIGREEKRLPGLQHLSMNKVFYLSYAQTWCGHSRSVALVRQCMTDPHAPLRTRVNGVMINHPHFSETFKCTKNSAMNPNDKCSLW